MPRPAPTVLLVAFAGCASGRDPDWYATFGDPGSAFTDADGVYRGPTLVDQVWLDCAPDEPAWLYTVYTLGWALDATVTIDRWYPDSRETHHLASHERGADNQWERFDATLPVVPEGEGVPDVSTELGCDWTFYTWRMGAVDPMGDESDCVVFGYDVDKVDPTGRCRELVLVGG
jgi:hypothetical protein